MEPNGQLCAGSHRGCARRSLGVRKRWAGLPRCAEGHRDQQELVGRPLGVTSPQGRFSTGASELDSGIPALIEAYGKHVHHWFEGGRRHLHVHLGMQGKWFRLPSERPPRPQLRLRLETGDAACDLIAPSVCEVLSAQEWCRIVAALGLCATTPTLSARAGDPPPPTRGRCRAVGSICDRRPRERASGRVADLGEDSSGPAGRVIGPRRVRSPLDTLARLMSVAVDDGRIVTARLEPHERATIAESDARMVYKQAVCLACGATVEMELIGGRASYACPQHQTLAGP